MSFPMHDEDTAPEAARAGLASTKENFGMIPNLERVMASAPPLLAGYSTLWDLFDETTLSPVERQIVYQTANFENECDYCVPWHTFLSREAGMEEVDIEALRTGANLSTSKLEALRSFARSLLHNRGKVTEADLERFMNSGFSENPGPRGRAWPRRQADEQLHQFDRRHTSRCRGPQARLAQAAHQATRRGRIGPALPRLVPSRPATSRAAHGW